METLPFEELKNRIKTLEQEVEVLYVSLMTKQKALDNYKTILKGCETVANNTVQEDMSVILAALAELKVIIETPPTSTESFIETNE